MLGYSVIFMFSLVNKYVAIVVIFLIIAEVCILLCNYSITILT